MAFNEEAWIQACEAWIKISNIIGFETRKDAFLQGYYMAYNKLNPVEKDDGGNKIIVKLDHKGRFLVEQLKPLLGDQTDAIYSYSVQMNEDKTIILKLFDKEGNPI